MKVHGSGLLGIAGIVSMLVLLGACGNGEDAGDNAGTGSPTSVGQQVESEAAPPGPPDNCPLTAAEVGDAVGVAVQQDATTCMFEPQPGKEPRVLYVRQV